MPQRLRATTPPTATAGKSGTTRRATTEALDRLAETARAEHRAIINLEGQALDHAIRAGEMLHQAKVLIHQERGSWSAWTADHLKISKQQADTYIRISNGQDKLVDLLPENRSIRRAADVLAGRADEYGVPLPRPPREETQAAEADEPVEENVPTEAAGAGESDAETLGRVKHIKTDPDELLMAVKGAGVKVKIAKEDLIDLLNVILEKVEAGIVLTTEEDEADSE